MNDLDFWTNWTSNVAYILGFAYADGTVNPKRDTLIICQKDRTILDMIALVSPFKSLIYSKSSKVWRLRFTSKGLTKVLSGYGVVPNKTEYGFWPPKLPVKYANHYIRGFLDGDGTFFFDGSRAALRFVCHKLTYLECLRNAFLEQSIDGGHIFKDGNNFRLVYSAKQKITMAGNYLYDNSRIFIPRKFEIFNQIRLASESSWYKDRHEDLRKLDRKQVNQIRTRAKTGESQRAIANDFPVNFQMISRIVRHEAYHDID